MQLPYTRYLDFTSGQQVPVTLIIEREVYSLAKSDNHRMLNYLIGVEVLNSELYDSESSIYHH